MRAARERHESVRAPLTEAEQTLQRLETESKTLMKLLAYREQEHVAAGDGQHHGGKGI